jgi:hypothetical protein
MAHMIANSIGECPVSSAPKSISFESPSLAAPTAAIGPAFELKFLLDESGAQRVEAWAHAILAFDPHGDPARCGAYLTTSLYCDTPELDVYYRSPSYRRRKFRARRYGNAPWIYLERKSKRGDRVAKRRTPIGEEELTPLGLPMSLVTWPGHWFHRSVVARRLGPACRIAYERTAYVGTCSEGPLRLTLDRRLRGMLAEGWNLGPFEGGLPLLASRVILELKFCSALPLPFKQLIQELSLAPSPVSKYRLCREAWGVPQSLREAADA